MSRSIDNRVVEMEFDNARFEKNVSKSLSTLDKLKAALSFKGVENSFENVEDATGGLAKSFSVLETVAVGALLNIGNKVADWAQKTIKDLSGVSNAMEGFSKFSKITQSSATLAAQSFSSGEIERELSRLNWFTDETSYNLTDMVDNISKFTASGQGLKESSDAMQGIALWAALSGQNAQTASRAMYQLSQAMSTYMKREDWRSIQNANMDTIEFRRMALEAAVKLGTLERWNEGEVVYYRSLIDGLKKEGAEAFTESQFVERLTSGMWFTKDVMMDVYRSYAKAAEQIYEYVEKHSGATVRDAIEALGDSLDEFGLKAFKAGQEARTWEDALNSVKDALSTKWEGIFESIFGKYEDATKFFTDLSYAFYDLFVEPMSRRVEGFARWADEGGASMLRGSVIDALYLILDLVTKIKDEFDDFFVWDSAKEKIDSIKNSWRKFTGEVEDNHFEDFELNISEYQKKNRDWQIYTQANYMDPDATDDRENYLTGRKTARLMKISEAIRSFVNSLKDYSDETHAFERILHGIFAVIDMVKQAFSGLFSAIKGVFSGGGNGATTLAKKFLDVLASIGDWLVKLNSKLKEMDFFKKFFETLLAPIVNLKNAVGEFIGVFGAKLKERFEGMSASAEDLSEAFSGVKNTLKKAIDIIANWWSKLFSNFDAEKLVNTIFNIADRIKQAFYDLTGIEPGTLGDRIKEGLEKIQNGLDNFKDTAPGKIKEAWETAKGWFGTAFDWIEEHWTDIAETIKSVWEGVWGFLSGIWEGVKDTFSDKEGGLSFEDLKETLKTIGQIIGALVSTIGKGLKPLLDGMKNSLENLSLGQIGAALAGGGAFAAGAGIYKIVKVVKNVSKGLEKILGGLGDILNGFAHLLDAKALKEAATAVAILVGALFVLILLPQDKLMTSVMALSVVLAIISKAMQKMTSMNRISIGKGGISRKSNSAGSTFMEVAFGLLLVSAAMKIIAGIPTDALYNALFVMGILIGIITVAIKSITKLNESKGAKKGDIYKNVSLVNMSGPAGMIMAFALLMFAFTNAITKLADVALNNMKGFVASFIVIAALITGMVFAITALSKVDIDSSNIAKTILSFAAVIFVIAKAIEIMAVLDPLVMAEAGLIIFAIIALLGAIISETKGRTFKNFDQLASGLKTFALVIAVMAGIVWALGQIPLEDLAKGVASIALITLMLYAMVSLSTSKDFKPANFKKMVDSLLYLSIVFAVLGTIVYAISQLSWGELGKGIVGIIAITAVIAALTLLASKTGNGMEKVGKVFMYIAIAAAALGIGLLAVAAGLKLLNDESLNIDVAFKKLTKLIEDFLRELPTWLALITGALVGWAVDLVAALIVEFINMAYDLIEKLKENDTINKLVYGIVEVCCLVIDALTNSLGRIVESVGGFIIELFRSLGQWAINNSGKIREALHTFVSGLLSIFLEFFNGVGYTIFHLITGEGEKEWEKWKKTAYEDITGWFTVLVGAIVTLWHPLIGTLMTIIGLITAIDTLSTQLAAQREAENAWRNADPDAAKKVEQYFASQVDKRYDAGEFGNISKEHNMAYQFAMEEAMQEASNYFVGGYRVANGRLLYVLGNETERQYWLASQRLEDYADEYGISYGDAYELVGRTQYFSDNLEAATNAMNAYVYGGRDRYQEQYGRTPSSPGQDKIANLNPRVTVNQNFYGRSLDPSSIYRISSNGAYGGTLFADILGNSGIDLSSIDLSGLGTDIDISSLYS